MLATNYPNKNRVLVLNTSSNEAISAFRETDSEVVGYRLGFYYSLAEINNYVQMKMSERISRKEAEKMVGRNILNEARASV
jgi:hypothetical protein